MKGLPHRSTSPGDLARVIPVFAALAAGQGVTAAEPSGGGHVLEEVVVKGQLLDNGKRAFSATTFTAEAIRDLELSRIQDVLDHVPGMSIRRFGLSGVADSITIRGFGGGGHGGDLGAVLDGIPLNEAMSHADGYVDLNVVIPLEVKGFTVFKGPVSTLYGNYNRGGLLKIDTRAAGDYRQADLSTGSDGLLDLQGALGTELGEAQQVNLAVQHVRSDGFRPQSDTRRSTVSGRWRLSLPPDTDVAVSGRWHSAESDNPGYLTAPQYRGDPYGIDPNMHEDGADKDFGTLRVDFNHELDERMKVLSFVYATRQDFTRWFTRPTGVGWEQREETYDRESFGTGASLNGDQVFVAMPVRWVAGIEAFRESTRYRYYEGLDDRRRRSAAINDRETDLDSASAFLELQADWHPLLMPSLGLRYDRFDGDCTPAGPEISTALCEQLNDLSQWSPKIGFRSFISDDLQLRASWARGFALPNGWVKYHSQAANLDPVTFRQYEIGFTWNPIEPFELDVAAYELTSDGEVRAVAPGVYENYGETERSGIEATLSWTPLEVLTFSAVYGVTDSEVLRHEDSRMVGNEVGGVSDYSATVRGEWRFLPSWRMDITWRGVGGFPIDDRNSAYSDSYDLLDLGLAYTGSDKWKVYLQVDNLADHEYAPSRFIIGGIPLYSPGAPRQFRVGLQMNL